MYGKSAALVPGAYSAELAQYTRLAELKAQLDGREEAERTAARERAAREKAQRERAERAERAGAARGGSCVHTRCQSCQACLRSAVGIYAGTVRAAMCRLHGLPALCRLCGASCCMV